MCFTVGKGTIFINTKSTKPKPKCKKLDYGDGSIYYVESRKCYAGQITLDISGKKKRKTAYGKTERIVKNKLLEYRIQAKAGLFDEVDNTTIYELAEKLIEEQFALNEIKQTSYDRKNETLKTLSPIYDIALREITEDEIKRFFISKISYSQSYLDKVYQLLKVVFNEGTYYGKSLYIQNCLYRMREQNMARYSDFFKFDNGCVGLCRAFVIQHLCLSSVHDDIQRYKLRVGR